MQGMLMGKSGSVTQRPAQGLSCSGGKTRFGGKYEKHCWLYALWLRWTVGFMPGGSDGKESACNAGDLGSIPGLGRFPGEGNGNPLQYSRLGNSMDRGTWWATVHGVTVSQSLLRD